MQVTYLDHLGTDLTVVNAARVSFGKRTEEWRGPRDARLLRFLARHKHELPFAHPHVSFHFKAPLFVARQLAKHQVGFVWSEISRRYVKGEPEFYWPDVWRAAAPDVKQGSLEVGVENQRAIALRTLIAGRKSMAEYKHLLACGVCAEQARMVLPQNMYTEWHWTGSLLGWARVWGLRVKPDAQRETMEITKQLDETMSALFPVSWAVLTQSPLSKAVDFGPEF